MSSSTPQQTNVRVFYFDYLRMLATIGVVFLHAAALIVTSNRGADIDFFSRFNIGNAFDALGRFGVNNFFMISGALLLAPRHRFRLRKQTLRVFWPLLSWSAIYAIANFAFDRAGVVTINGSGTDHDSVTGTIRSAIEGPLAYHLWFVYVLLGIYLVVPLLRPLTALPAERRAQLLRYALALWLIFSVLIPCIGNLWADAPRIYPSAVPSVPLGYLGVALLGFYLHTAPIRIPRPLLAAGAIAGLGATFLLVFLEQAHGDGSLWAYSNLSPNVLLFTICVFLLAKDSLTVAGPRFGLVALFSKLSFRIYLMHALVLHYLRSLSPLSDWYQANPLPAIPVLVVLTLLITFTFSLLIERVRPLRAYL